MPNLKPGDRVTYWLIAESCLCDNNNHPPVPELPEPAELAAARDEHDAILSEIEGCAGCDEAHASSKGDSDVCGEHLARLEVAEAKRDGFAQAHAERVDAHAQAHVAKHHAIATYAELVRKARADHERARADHERAQMKLREEDRTRFRDLAPEPDLVETPCGHLRVLAGYPATVRRAVRDRDEAGRPFVYYELDVEFPESITGKSAKRDLGYATRQSHVPLAVDRRPESGDCTTTGHPLAPSAV